MDNLYDQFLDDLLYLNFTYYAANNQKPYDYGQRFDEALCILSYYTVNSDFV